jgi:hypothetical protein
MEPETPQAALLPGFAAHWRGRKEEAEQERNNGMEKQDEASLSDSAEFRRELGKNR